MPGAPDMKPPVRRRRNGVSSIAVGDAPRAPVAAPEQPSPPAPAASPPPADLGPAQDNNAETVTPPQLTEPAAVEATAGQLDTEADQPPAPAGSIPAVRQAPLPAKVPGTVVHQPRLILARPREPGLLEELLTLGESARRSPGDWESYSPNLRGDVNDAFKDWVSDYAIGTGNFGISKNHCLHAALSRMPLDDRGLFDLEQVAQVGREWLAEHPGRGAASARGGQSSVGKQLAGRLRILAKKLPTVKPKIELWAVLSAYVSLFMEDNPPPRPGL
jgi:hypothetical protein